MDADRILELALANLQDSIAEANGQIARVEAARAKTAEVLTLAGERGVDRVAIGKSHDSMPATIGCGDWARSSMFQHPPDKDDATGWPVIWGVAKECGVHGGCGNRGQVQVNGEMLIDGVYHLREGKWFRVE